MILNNFYRYCERISSTLTPSGVNDELTCAMSLPSLYRRWDLGASKRLKKVFKQILNVSWGSAILIVEKVNAFELNKRGGLFCLFVYTGYGLNVFENMFTFC